MITEKTVKQTLHYHTVSEINTYIKSIIEYDYMLSDVWIKGEVSNLKVYHLGKQRYFNLSDGQSQINCVMYGNVMERLDFKLENGVQVYVRGGIKVFHKRGSLSFQVVYMTKEGKGKLSQEFEKLKAKLLKEGVFDQEKKKELPPYPQRVGVVTAYDSAAMWDFIKSCQQRAPHIKLTISPATVQGETCARRVIEALEILKKKPQDVIAIIRGGGSAEDLAGFNDERLVRYVGMYEGPIISAIGHEIDYTLTDFAADFRGSTPTSAAQILTEKSMVWRNTLEGKLEKGEERVRTRYKDYIENLKVLLEDAKQVCKTEYERSEQRVEHLIRSVERCNPLHKLKQGYSISRFKKTGAIVKSITQLKENEEVETQLSDGRYSATITNLEKHITKNNDQAKIEFKK